MSETMQGEGANKPKPVLLVGAGPGAADLITVRGAKALGDAEVVLYDDLANAELLGLCPAGAEKIYVGKRAGAHSVSQDEINRLLVEKARSGRRVVRLKGGDPMFFGRTAEEIEALATAGFGFEIVPGVTAGSAAGAAAGIPLTQRGVTSATVFVAGHACADRNGAPTDWKALAALRATLCVYMGTKRFGIIARELIAGGLPETTPVAVVAGATLTNQSLRVGTLADGEALVGNLQGRPAMIVIGEVVKWSELAGAGLADHSAQLGCEI
ncbi:MAG TPA: uroporphyrinogen-III C-methyltransferase [Opitutus sp.]|nr:uroporphyrinogen-III C-methyltransferase [Opitutus sp.]